MLNNNLLVYLKVAEHCQLSCQFCFFRSGSAPKKLLDIDKSIQWFINLEKICPWVQNPAINFFGGEPMLAPLDSLNKFIDKTKNLWGGKIRYTITSNLVYPLTEDRLKFLNRLDSISTSWDADSRFATEGQFNIWKKNCKLLIHEHKKDLTVQITLTKQTLDYNLEKIYEMCKDIGFADLQFEKLSMTGGALENIHVMPNNKELDEWFVKMYNLYINKQYYKSFSNSFLNGIFSAYLFKTFSGCRSRNCMTKVFTINANETIGTCPNFAMIPSHQIGNLDIPVIELLASKARQKSICSESTIDSRCLNCEVYDICNAGCMSSTTFSYENICSEAKSLMIYLKKEANYKLYKEILNGFKGSEIPIFNS